MVSFLKSETNDINMCDTNAEDFLVRKQLSKIRGQQVRWFGGNNA